MMIQGKPNVHNFFLIRYIWKNRNSNPALTAVNNSNNRQIAPEQSIVVCLKIEYNGNCYVIRSKAVL